MSGFSAIALAHMTSARPAVMGELLRWPEHEPPILPAALLAILILLLAVLAARMAWRLVKLLTRPDENFALFGELADAHGLDPSERRMLRQLARRENISNPAKVFTEKRHLEAYARFNTDVLYRRLYERLFGG